MKKIKQKENHLFYGNREEKVKLFAYLLSWFWLFFLSQKQKLNTFFLPGYLQFDLKSDLSLHLKVCGPTLCPLKHSRFLSSMSAGGASLNNNIFSVSFRNRFECFAEPQVSRSVSAE